MQNENPLVEYDDEIDLRELFYVLWDQKRIALFTLVDGTLAITCDGKEGNVTVSTNTN